MTAMIELDNLSKSFGNLVAVDGIDLKVNKGEVLGFLGPNGAGKSTTMKMIAGFIEPTSGTANICGLNVLENPVLAKSRIGYLPEGAPTYGDMTARRFLDFVSEIRGFDGTERRRRVDMVVDRVILQSVLDQPIDTLSKGFKRRVGLAQAMLHDPEILILDEPTDGLDPNQKQHVRRLIKDMAADKAIIVSTHILEEVEAVCTRAVIISHGKLLIDGTPEELMSKAHNHNAVVISVDSAYSDKVIEVVPVVSGVKGIDHIGKVGSIGRFRILPQPGSTIAEPVSAALREAGVDVQELYVERGALDEVFRQITVANPEAGEDKHA